MGGSEVRLLLIGPYPPPHGGISVHLATAHSQLRQRGVHCRVLNVNRLALESDEYIWIRSHLDLALALLRYARYGWTLHLHTNGHNLKSWLMALLCGLAGRLAPASLLTLHSGMAPLYLATAPRWRRRLIRYACSLYTRIICVNEEIREVLAALGVPRERLEVLAAFLATSPPEVALPAELEEWMRRHQPLLSTALFFRPEYGFSLLVEALAHLRSRYPALGCLVMGSGEEQAQAEMLVRRKGMAESIALLGDVPHDFCLALMARSNVFVRATLGDGDAVSVREALSLGVPVVASDVGTRPAGTLLFKAGDMEDLIEKIEAALEEPRRAHARWQSDGLDKLLAVYDSLNSPQSTRRV